jgi:hypothetical protein
MESSFQPAIAWTIRNNLITGSVAKQCKELILARLSIILNLKKWRRNDPEKFFWEKLKGELRKQRTIRSMFCNLKQTIEREDQKDIVSLFKGLPSFPNVNFLTYSATYCVKREEKL